MVKSGLDNKIVEDQAVPRVSHYRLAAHLGTALTIYAAMMVSAFDLLAKPSQEAKVLEMLRSPQAARLKTLSLVTLGLVATTIMSGALVAGLDAGLVYNEFPLMGGKIIPTDLLALTPKWKNFLENTTTVQFDHRYLVRLISFDILPIPGDLLNVSPLLSSRRSRQQQPLAPSFCIQGAFRSLGT